MLNYKHNQHKNMTYISSTALRFKKKNLLIAGIITGFVGIILLILTLAATPGSGDLNGDNKVDIADLSILLTKYGTNDPAADINGDGTVNITDLSLLLTLFGTNVQPTNTIAFRLINGDTRAVIGNLANGQTIDLNTMPTSHLNIEAVPSGTSESVRFGLDGNASFRTENTPPYTLQDETGIWTPPVGSHIVTATAFSADNATGTQVAAGSVQFT
jgi:hypothetical protein